MLKSRAGQSTEGTFGLHGTKTDTANWGIADQVLCSCTNSERRTALGLMHRAESLQYTSPPRTAHIASDKVTLTLSATVPNSYKNVFLVYLDDTVSEAYV